MISRQLEIVNRLGLHARAAAKLVKLSATFDCDIDIEKDGQRVNSKSIMGVMMLAASCGSTVTLHVDGPDEGGRGGRGGGSRRAPLRRGGMRPVGARAAGARP